MNSNVTAHGMNRFSTFNTRDVCRRRSPIAIIFDCQSGDDFASPRIQFHPIDSRAATHTHDMEIANSEERRRQDVV